MALNSQNLKDTPENFKNNKSPETPQSTYTFEEAIGLTGCGKFHYLLLLTCGLCCLAFMSQFVCIGLILPFVKCDVSATITEEGLLSSAGFYGLVCSSHIMGFLGDTWGRRHTLKWSLILSAIAAVISAFSVNIWMLIVTRFFTGFFGSGLQACVLSFCNEFHSNRTRGRHVTLVSVFLPLSIVYSALEALAILPMDVDINIFGLIMSAWRWLLLAINIVSILAYILLCFIPETPKYDLVHGNHEKALNTMRKIFKINTGRPIEEYPVHQIKMETTGAKIGDVHGIGGAAKMMWKQTIALFYKDLILHTLNICFILFVTYALAHGLLAWIPTIILDAINRKHDLTCRIISDVETKDRDACEGGQIKQLTMMFWVMVFVGAAFVSSYLLLSLTVQFVGKRNILIIQQVVCSVCCIGIHWISNFPMTVLALTLTGSVGNCGGIVGTIAVEFYPTNISAMSMCFVMMIGRLGAAAGSNIFAWLLFSHCDMTFWLLTGILLLTAVLCWFLPEQKMNKKNPITAE